MHLPIPGLPSLPDSAGAVNKGRGFGLRQPGGGPGIDDRLWRGSLVFLFHGEGSSGSFWRRS
jgi:hypothetical protein